MAAALSHGFGSIFHVKHHLVQSPLLNGIPDFRTTRIRLLCAETPQELFPIRDEAERHR